MTTPRIHLAEFAAGLTDRLPGMWTVDHHRRPTPRETPAAEQLWDTGHVAHVAAHNPRLNAVLHGPDEQRLYVSNRPRYRRHFVVAPLEPDDDHIKPHHLVGIDEPNGIDVPDDPARRRAHHPPPPAPLRASTSGGTPKRRRTARPPYLSAPAQVSHVVTLTWYPDGTLATPYANVPREARTTLYSAGFQYHPDQGAFLLDPAHGTDGHALRIHAAARRLAGQGIGVNLRHSAPAAAPTLPPALPTTTRGPRR